MDNSDEEVKKRPGSIKIKRQTSRKGSTKHKKKEIKIDKDPDGSRSPDEPIEMLTPKHNGYVEGEDGDSDEEKGKNTASIKGMWKKALKTLKSNDTKQNRLAKKASFTKKKDSEEEEEPQEISKDIDPVYSLLKCAADLPKVPKGPKDGPCGSFLGNKSDSLDSTSKASSPSSSASHSPKTRRKKLCVRMKSFSLEMPEPPKQLLGIEELPKKSPSFTSNSFDKGQSSSGGSSATKKRLTFSSRSPSVENEDSKDRSRTPSPELSPKIKKKEDDVYVSLYHFRAKEKDDMDLRPGSRVTVKTKSKTDWWKGKCNGKSGYFPAKYLLKLEKYQRVYQVTQTLNLTELDGVGLRLHKDQIVVGVGETESNPTTIHVRTANKREALCPSQFLSEV